ncbi:cell division cycle and apoptosis regulator protein 1-like isoform X1 [Polyodon spathula]|uniref:cell division cycle and apoptosis regulator protein 1-like isoform X1 n=1 Tax=Polyodon spathula TaxID=7913 RepID=UPI001B7DADF6|nr:cell division cycle and apoptosis regulator protein 1-like isoform X1 [Polyodon spathula]XP_041117159.1 cell division cycle and apoptosis regulator protein 1-like isoform X1 [Polyodon spathula]
MAQFGGQKNPPWAAQFAASAVSQQGQSLDMNSLHSLGVQQPSLLGASPAMYSQQSAMAAANLNSQSAAANYQLSQQTAALQQQAAAAAAAALQQQYQQQQQQQQQQPQQTMYSVQQQVCRTPQGLLKLQPPHQALHSQPSVALPTSLSMTNPQQTAQITVSYPTPRSSQQQAQPQKQRVFTGVVTKLHDTFGFVDEDVFFQISAVKGKTPQVGDRVLVEAAYNPNMPFKWNAQRIQTLPHMSPQMNQPQGPPLLKANPAMMQSLPPPPSFSLQAQAPPPCLLQAQLSAVSLAPLLQNPPQPLLPQPPQKDCVFSGGLLQPPVRMMPQPQPARRLDPVPRFPVRNDRVDLMVNRKDDRSRERERERRRSRERSPQRKRSRDRSPRRERSPRRARRIVPRYTVQFSKFSLDCFNCDMMELRRRYQNLYIPSDFFDAEFTWVDAFPVSRPFQFGNYCNFHIMHREVDSLVKNTSVLDPPDANHLYSAKVMLLANPSLEELYHKSCALADDPQELREAFQHPARLIKFLVGMKGKDEAMAIGGHWSPSLDGANPEKDPSVLIKTAIRSCKALTGIDLSLCTQWYRFAEIRYHRPEETHKGRTVPAHVETVVLFLPDVWHCLPTRSEWETLSRGYKQQLSETLQAERKEADGEQEEEEKDEGELKELSTPTHWSKLDPKSMKVNDLRKELESRSLSSKGLKSQLIARLTKQLKVEEQTDEIKEPEKPVKVEEEEEEQLKVEEDREEEERKRQEEAERQRRERRYILPDEPTIIVHPNWTAKNGKFDCSVMSLSVLLDYRLEDNKEHSFEVSLFAELFNEMLQRDFGYRIYKALAAIPVKDEKKEKKEKAKKEVEKKEAEKKEAEKKECDKKEAVKKEEAIREVKEEKEEDNEEPAAKKIKITDEREEKKEREKEEKKEESKDDEENEEGSSNTNPDEYDPMEAEEAEDDDEEEKEEETSDKDKKDEKIEEKKSRERSSKDKEKEKKQMTTYNKDLLMAFVYFDQSHCGYLLEKDLEEIMHTIGLHLSRAQVKKLLNKTAVRESCFYRKLTDRAKDEAIPEIPETPQELLLGNKALLPCHHVKQEQNEPQEAGSLIVYNGAMVDVGSLIQKLEKSEKDREGIEQKLQSQEAKIEEDANSILQLETANKSFSTELEDVKNCLGQTEENLKDSEDKKSCFEEHLCKTATSLSIVLNELESVLRKDKPQSEENDNKSKENGSDE